MVCYCSQPAMRSRGAPEDPWGAPEGDLAFQVGCLLCTGTSQYRCAFYVRAAHPSTSWRSDARDESNQGVRIPSFACMTYGGERKGSERYRYATV